jgi:protein TonB
MVVSLGVYGGIAALVVVFGAATQSEAVQEKLDVIFRSAPAVTNEPPPPPAPKQAAPAKAKPFQRSQQAMPVAIPDAAPTVSEAAAPAPSAQVADAPVAALPTAPVAPTRSRDPINLPENATPPQASEGNTAPAFPEVALSMGAGSEALVILKIVVEQNGSVGRIQVMKGDEPFASAAIAAVKGWHYIPALVDGQPVAVFRIVKIPFRLRG